MNTILLTNEKIPKTWQNLEKILGKHDIVRIRLAVSYLMKSGAELVKKRLNKLTSNNVPVEIVFGDDMGISESEALRILSDIKCSLFVYRSSRSYHPKIWMIDHSDGKRTIYIGSANLSDSGLQSNVEAGLLIEGTEDETQEYHKLWEAIKNNSIKVDDDFISSYKNIEDENKIKFKLKKNGKVDYEGNYGALKNFISGWMQYIANPVVKHQIEKWRGWYLLPSQGNITISKLRELGRVLSAIEKSPQYQHNKYLDIGSSAIGINNVSQIIKEAGVTYVSKYTKSHRRALFVRQQKNYLEHLGFIKDIGHNRIIITDRGVDLGASLHEPELREAFSHSLKKIYWPHGNIYFYPFLLELINRMPDKCIYQSEIDLFIIHTYNQSQLDNRVEIINMFRSLPVKDRENLYDWAHNQLGSLLGMYRNASAHGHYKGKIYELMVAFCSTSELKYIKEDNPPGSYLTLRT